MRLPSARPWKPGYPVAPPARAAMRRHGGPAKRARRRGTMCPSPHQGETDQGCTFRPFPDLAPVRKCLGTFSAQFYDFRPVQAQIAATRRRTLRIMVRIVRQGKEIARCWRPPGRNSMRKISLVAAIASMLAGVTAKREFFFGRHVDATTFLLTMEAHMTSEQVALVQSSFKSVVPIASKATDLFYERLFEV